MEKFSTGRRDLRPSRVDVHYLGGLVVLLELGVVGLGVVVFAVPVVPVVVPVFVLLLLLNCCEAFRKLSGSFAT